MKINSKETARIEESQKFAIKFADLVLVFGCLFSILIIFYSIYKIYNVPESISLKFFIKSILFSGISAISFLLLLRLKNNFKVNLALLIFSLGISIYTIEIYFEIVSANIKKYNDNNLENIIQEKNENGLEVFSNYYPSNPLVLKSNGLKTANGNIYPLSGISNIVNIVCNESGYWSIYNSDEHGFNNRKNLYNTNKTDIVLIGDSFTEGSCVRPDETIGSNLEESGFNVINLGKGSNGPLLELAILREYAEPLAPKILLWIYFTNDLVELKNEIKSTFLKNYLNANEFTQDLFARQNEINSVMRNFYSELDKKENKIEKVVQHWLPRVLRLSNLRTKLNLTPKLVVPSVKSAELDTFRRILKRSKIKVNNWGGKMYFVYLPAFKRYSNGNEHKLREPVLRTISALDIPLIDIHTEVFSTHPDPLSLFPNRINNHYNSEGYYLVAEAIENRLKADGIIPSNSKN